MSKFLAMFVSVLIAGTVSSARAQDATGLPQTQTQTPSPSPSPSDTTSPLTPSDSSTSSPLTPSQPNPITGQQQQQQSSSAAAVQSSSEVPSTFVQTPIEANRIDPSAPSELQLEIDPSSTGAASLSPDQTQLSPTAAGVSLNAVQGTTSLSPPAIGASSPSPISTSIYPATIAEPASTQTALSEFQQLGISRELSGHGLGSNLNSRSMGPAIGSAAVRSSSPVESMMSSNSVGSGSSTFIRTLRSSTFSHPTFASGIIRSSSIGPSALRMTFGGSSSAYGSSHRVMISSSHR